MHRLNLTIDESLYERARAIGFIEKKSISQIVRESLKEYISKKNILNRQVELVLDAKDEKEILSIISNDDFISDNEFKSKFKL